MVVDSHFHSLAAEIADYFPDGGDDTAVYLVHGVSAAVSAARAAGNAAAVEAAGELVLAALFTPEQIAAAREVLQ